VGPRQPGQLPAGLVPAVVRSQIATVGTKTKFTRYEDFIGWYSVTRGVAFRAKETAIVVNAAGANQWMGGETGQTGLWVGAGGMDSPLPCRYSSRNGHDPLDDRVTRPPATEMPMSLYSECDEKRRAILRRAKQLADDGAHYLWGAEGQR